MYACNFTDDLYEAYSWEYPCCYFLFLWHWPLVHCPSNYHLRNWWFRWKNGFPVDLLVLSTKHIFVSWRSLKLLHSIETRYSDIKGLDFFWTMLNSAAFSFLGGSEALFMKLWVFGNMNTWLMSTEHCDVIFPISWFSHEGTCEGVSQKNIIVT